MALSEEQKRAYIELNKRGKLSGKQKAAFDQLVARGTIKLEEPKKEPEGNAFIDAVQSFNSTVEELPLGLIQGLGRLVGSEKIEAATQRISAQNQAELEAAKERSPKASFAGQLAGVVGPIAATAPLGATSAAGRIATGAGLGALFGAGQVAEEGESKLVDTAGGALLGAGLAGALEGIGRGIKATRNLASGRQRALGRVARESDEVDTALAAQRRLQAEGLPSASLTPGQASGSKFLGLREEKLIGRAGSEAGEAALKRAGEQAKFANEALDFVNDKLLGGTSREALDEFASKVFNSIDDLPVDQTAARNLVKRNPTTFKIIAEQIPKTPGLADEIAKGGIKPGTVGELRVARQFLDDDISRAFRAGEKGKARALLKVKNEIDDVIKPATGDKYEQANKAFSVGKIADELQAKLATIKPKLSEKEFAPSQIYDKLFAKQKDFDQLVSIAKRANPALEGQLKDLRTVLRRIGLNNLDSAAKAAISDEIPRGLGSVIGALRSVGSGVINKGIIKAAFNPNFADELAKIKQAGSRKDVAIKFADMLRKDKARLAGRTAERTAEASTGRIQ